MVLLLFPEPTASSGDFLLRQPGGQAHPSSFSAVTGDPWPSPHQDLGARSKVQAGIVQPGAGWAGSLHRHHVEKQGSHNGAASYTTCTPLTTNCPLQKSDQSRKKHKGFSDAFQKESGSVRLSCGKSADLGGAGSDHRLTQRGEPWADTPSGRHPIRKTSSVTVQPKGGFSSSSSPCCMEEAHLLQHRGNPKTVLSDVSQPPGERLCISAARRLCISTVRRP